MCVWTGERTIINNMLFSFWASAFWGLAPSMLIMLRERERDAHTHARTPTTQKQKVLTTAAPSLF